MVSLHAERVFDRETTSGLIVELEARDFGGNITIVNVTVDVGDVNDCDVKFAREEWDVKLREDGKLSHDVIEALDDDDPKQSAFYFYLKGDGE